MRRREGELVELSVERIGAAGDGVARWRGEPVFLPFTVPGDHVRARLGSRRGGGLEAHVVELMDAGPGRVSAALSPFRALRRMRVAAPRSRSLPGGQARQAAERAGTGPGSTPGSSSRCGWFRRCGGGHGSVSRALVTRASRCVSGFESASRTIWSICANAWCWSRHCSRSSASCGVSSPICCRQAAWPRRP